MSKVEEKKEYTQEEKIEMLTRYQCDNCKKEFYVIAGKREFVGNSINGKPIFDKLPEVCPYCESKKKNLRKLLTKKQTEKLNKDKEKEEKKIRDEKVRIAEIERKKIFDDVKDLAKDLRRSLFDNKITPSQFTTMFMNLSFKIAKKTADELPIDWTYYRRIMLDFVQDIMDSYDIKIDCEQEYDDLKENLSENKVYVALNSKYIDDDKYALKDFEMKDEIETEFELKKRQKENERLEKIAEINEKKYVNNDEFNLKKELKSGVNNI